MQAAAAQLARARDPSGRPTTPANSPDAGGEEKTKVLPATAAFANSAEGRAKVCSWDGPAPLSLRHLCTIVAACDPTRVGFYYAERTKKRGSF